MKFEVCIAGSTRAVEIMRQTSGLLQIRLDGVPLNMDAVEIGGGAYSILLGGCAFEAQVFPAASGGLSVRCGGIQFPVEIRDPRAWRAQRGALQQAEGLRQVASPMPGKVVRVLVASKESVEAGQGLLVLEAMKMQNEIRAPKSGRVERLFVREGQTVAAGEPLVSIE